MTDRYYALTVILDRDIREDDAEGLLAAIRQLRGIADVRPQVVDPEALVAQVRSYQLWVDRLDQVIKELRP